jgi:pimeloyl-ACP methyl ester carboxylesterase
MPHRRFALNRETLVLDDALRSAIPGTFIDLPGGRTWYELAGPVDGIPVVFINGYSIPHHLWDNNFNALAEAGFRVLRFDHFGRGWSDRPEVTFDENLFDQQILDLLNALRITGKVSLVGSSMGGIVASIFSIRHPERVNRLVLLDPAGTMDKPRWPKSLLLIPGIGEMVMYLTGDRTIPAGMAEDLLRPERYPEYVEKYLPQMKIAGFKRAILSTYRSGLLFDRRDVYERLAKMTLPILLVWGRHDATIPLATGEEVRRLMPAARWWVIEDAGHVPHYERPDVVNPLLVDFLE